LLDPTVLRRRLEETDSAIKSWTSMFYAASEEVSAASSIVENASRVLISEVQRQEAVVDRLTLTAAELESDSGRISAAASSVLGEAGNAASEAQSVLSTASSAHTAWQWKFAEAQTELGAAHSELGQAQSELQAAQFELSAAQNAVARARAELSEAEAAVRQASAQVREAGAAVVARQNSYATDERGNRVAPNCSREQQQYGAATNALAAAGDWARKARAQLEDALQAVNAAQMRLSSAQARVSRAQARVARAQGRVAFAQGRVAELVGLVAKSNDLVRSAGAAVSMAQTAVATASDATAVLAGAQLSVSRCAEHLASARGHAAEGKIAATNLNSQTREFSSHNHQQRSASTAAVNELASMDEELRLFDHPLGLI
jgi:chromosome segregation ATPase